MATKKNGKTNKTAHVLNVLAGAGHDEVVEPPVEERQPPQKRQSTRAHTLEIARTDDEVLSEAIRDSLQNIENEQSDAPEAPLEPQTQEAEPVMEADEQPVMGEEKSMTMEPEEIEEAPDSMPPPPIDPPRFAQTPEKAAQLRLEIEASLGYVNIMQALVEEKAQKYMDMLKVCNCSRCVADVKAIALTNLPAKYAVIEEGGDVIPMLTVYEGRYNSLLTAQLIKACELTSASPRHK